METPDTREWLLTNGLGSFASGTVCDAHTRTYHGWLVAAMNPPGRRTLLLSRVDAYLWIGSTGFELSTNFWGSGAIAPQGYQRLQSFQISPVPTWIWGTDDWQFTREILLPYGLIPDETTEQPRFRHQVLVRYRYTGQEEALLTLRPLIGDRNFHHQQTADSDLHFSQVVEDQRVLFQATRADWLGVPWQLSWSAGTYCVQGVWYRDYRFPEETKRGLGDREDLYSPGYLNVALQPGQSVTLEARVRGLSKNCPFVPPDEESFAIALNSEQHRRMQVFSGMAGKSTWSDRKSLPPRPAMPPATLLQASDQFVAYRASIAGPTVIAGYPWFGDWGRDTLIALPGLALSTGRYALARGLLETFGRYCKDGLIPNTFPDSGESPLYNSLDAVLWWVETLGLYLEATQDWAFLVEQYPTVRSIYKAFVTGTHFNIRIDARDGLVTWEAPGYALTWMDALVNGQPITPRQGKPVEINALWYSALCWAQQWAERLKHSHEPGNGSSNYENHARRYAQQAKQVKAALQKFWNPQKQFFYDTISPNDTPNDSVRPNAVIALSLAHCGFSPEQARQVVQTTRDRLLTPYGLRSLDPDDPQYIGVYEGNPAQRDRAYHQGTVWSWLIGPFIRAWKRFYPNDPLPWNPTPMLEHLEQQACLGSISEIFDGNAPHQARGAIAQAWSVAELLRHWQEIAPYCEP